MVKLRHFKHEFMINDGVIIYCLNFIVEFAVNVDLRFCEFCRAGSGLRSSASRLDFVLGAD